MSEYLINSDKKTAIILFNLGGPDSLSAVKPFLFNLFNDSAIISLPKILRYFLAKIISSKREKTSKEIYSHIGNKSPILEQTEQQKEVLHNILSENDRVNKSADNIEIFTSMRYWHPMSDEVVKNVKKYNPDNIILLPLYPQFSKTTTGSSFDDWNKSAKKHNISNILTAKIRSYPDNNEFIAAHVKLIREEYFNASSKINPRILFSAHGLPEKNIKNGDPYQSQIEKTVAAIIDILAIDNLDSVICYQSKVGRLAWIKPSTEDEIIRAGADNVPVIIVPVSFVSEHSETLVELDIEYRNLAKKHNISNYRRVKSLQIEDDFINALANMCLSLKEDDRQVYFERNNKIAA